MYQNTIGVQVFCRARRRGAITSYAWSVVKLATGMSVLPAAIAAMGPSGPARQARPAMLDAPPDHQTTPRVTAALAGGLRLRAGPRAAMPPGGTGARPAAARS